jgi:hypothetical protein
MSVVAQDFCRSIRSIKVILLLIQRQLALYCIFLDIFTIRITYRLSCTARTPDVAVLLRGHLTTGTTPEIWKRGKLNFSLGLHVVTASRGHNNF